MLSKGKQEFDFKFYKIKVKGTHRIFTLIRLISRGLDVPCVRNPGSDKFM